MSNFDRADFIFSLDFSLKWQIQGQKFVWTYLGNLEKSKVLNIIEDLQIPDILEICYSYNLL
jgi:hypothetical protein